MKRAVIAKKFPKIAKWHAIWIGLGIQLILSIQKKKKLAAIAIGLIQMCSQHNVLLITKKCSKQLSGISEKIHARNSRSLVIQIKLKLVVVQWL